RWQALLPSVSACASTFDLLLAVLRTQHLMRVLRASSFGGGTLPTHSTRARNSTARDSPGARGFSNCQRMCVSSEARAARVMPSLVFTVSFSLGWNVFPPSVENVTLAPSLLAEPST